MNRVVVYIDGFNLYFGLKAKGWRRYYWLNPLILAQNLLKSDQQLVKVKYFTARISTTDPHKHKRQATWLEAIETLNDTKVFYGHYLSKQKQCLKCGATWTAHEEKMTDVNIAVEVLRDAYDDLFDTALIISADSDLAPPVEAVRSKFPAKRIIIVSPPDRHSKKLESVANASFQLGRKTLQDSQFPDEYTKPGGYVLKRPASWR